jgi:uncharacterized protein YndB with AHSA1/START domain
VIRASASTDIARSPAQVFALLDDFTRIPEWNDRCVEIRQVGDGEHARGSKLVYRYRYREVGAEGEIAGEIRDYEHDRRLAMHYEDHALVIHVAFELSACGSGTRLVHTAEIATKSWKVSLLRPIIHLATRRQTEHSVAKLRVIAEAT